MPVKLSELRERSSDPRARLPRPGSVADAVLGLLREDAEEAWRPAEIAERLDVGASSVSPALSRLRARGLIDHLQGHWFALPDDESAKRQAAIYGNRMANERLGREDPERWPRVSRDG